MDRARVMTTIKLHKTTSATAKPLRGGYCAHQGCDSARAVESSLSECRAQAGSTGYLLPVNTTTGGCACTLNTRYDGMQLPEDILSLAHYPKTVVLREYYL